MEHGDHRWLVRVIAGDDTLRQERLTRALHDELREADGAAVGFITQVADIGGGRKGGLAGDVALWAAVTAAGRPASQVLITLIREWCARDRHRKVEVTYDGNSVTITGHPDEAQERIVRDFLGRATENALGDEETEAK
ncbi:MAG: hypothetical protein ACRDP6_01685 [Actinoallomurus sp.]